jgi:hypothetical protein
VDLGGALKAAQWLNAVYSLALTFMLLRLCELMRPQCAPLKQAALLLLGMLPVYYKSFAFVRPEPLLAWLALIAVSLTVRMVVRADGRLRRAVGLGVVWGLLILTRQGGFCVVAACAVLLLLLVSALRWRGERASLCAVLAISVLVAGAVGGWFYAHLHRRYGSVTASNTTPRPRLAWSNWPREFYTELRLRALFTDPIRPSFDARLIPQFYSEVWGDYLGYFTVYGQDTRTGRYLRGIDVKHLLARPPAPAWLKTNRQTIAGYLGRVNCIALLPSVVLMIGTVAGAWCALRVVAANAQEVRTLVCAVLGLVVIVSSAGYLWFLVRYPYPVIPESVVKATYVLHTFPVMALLAAETLQQLRQRSVVAYRVLMAGLSLVALHTLPACMTRRVVGRPVGVMERQQISCTRLDIFRRGQAYFLLLEDKQT